ncbi:MAG: tetratricopeptide repeat protein [Bacteroidales bacterium]|nr:tetratricopeptide repeat protein [Bacteroidales bacterium]
MKIRQSLIQLFIVAFIGSMFLGSCSVFRKTGKSAKISSKEKTYLNYKFSFYEGERQMMLGNLSLASQYFLQCNKLMPDRATPYFQLAQLYYMTKDYHNAVKYTELAHNRAPENLWISEFLVNLYEGFNKYDKAAELLKDVLRLKPGDYTYLMESARVASILGKNAEALKTYNYLEGKFGISETTSLAKEKLFLAKKDYPNAENEINGLINVFPNEKKYIGLKGDLLILQRKYDEAETFYQKAIEEDPDVSPFHIALAEIYQLKKQPEKAIAELKIAFANTDVDIQRKVEIIYSYMRYYQDNQKIFSEIEPLITTLIKANPKSVESHTIYSDYLVQAKRYKDAREQLIMIKDKAKDNYLLWEQLVFLDVNLEDNKAMYNHATEATELFPNQPKFFLYAGSGAFMIHKYADAIKPLRNGLDLLVSDSAGVHNQFYTYLGESYYHLKKQDSTFYYFDLAVTGDSTNYSLMNNYSYYLALADTGLDKALTMIKRVIKQYPENQTYLDTYAWVLYKQKKYEEALRIIDLAVKDGGSSSAAIMEHQGDILFKNGKKEEAISVWEKAMKLGKGSEFLLQKIKEGKLIE